MIAACCNKQDCYPTEIKYVGTSLFAQRRKDGAWVIVPPQKIERNRDNPDGRTNGVFRTQHFGQIRVLPLPGSQAHP